ncbi:inhibitor of growth protein 2 [Rhinatrema bivittatum]|uniref:inhibitor of growth protein 2 n=1 Tax=Rhinatrema bivittatum TaxID=194408 RepID=UPI00112DB1C6|nr:inhibitor of growth protein 2 [Rhinatrema bivittatum]
MNGAQAQSGNTGGAGSGSPFSHGKPGGGGTPSCTFFFFSPGCACSARREAVVVATARIMLGQQQSYYYYHCYLPGSAGEADGSPLVSYVQEYLECVESLPLDIQRNVSLLREIDTKYREVLREIDDVCEKHKNESDEAQKKRLQQHLQRALISSQEFGDEKLQIVTQMLELVENRARQMEAHYQCFQDPSEMDQPTEKGKVDPSQPERISRRPRRQRSSDGRDLCHVSNGMEEREELQPKEKRSKSAKKKKRSKTKQDRELSPIDFAVDPDEPTYCLCNQVSYGEMIGCDNGQCPIEWFHFSCVGLSYKPKGKWYCPKCRGDNEKTMDKCPDKMKKERRSR